MARLLAFVLFGLALAAAGNDLIMASDKGKPFEFLPIGQYWFELHRESLQLVQPALERYGFEFVWDPVLLWLLVQPAAPALAILSVVFWVLGRRRGPRKPRRSRMANTNNKSPSQREAPARRTDEGNPHAGPHREAHTAHSGAVRRMR